MGCLHFLLLVFTGIALVQFSDAKSTDRSKRGVPAKYAEKWEMPIPYAINNGYTDEQKAKIKAGINSIMENTCVDFKEDFGSSQKMEYINLNKCSSLVGDSRTYGNVYPGNHTVSLSLNCLNVGNVQHETMHALGFGHTQNRPDRDEYLTVDLDNVLDLNKQKNFEKMDTDDYEDYGIPYEFGSRMHYSAGEMGKRGTVVLTPKDRDYSTTMGASKVLTFYDWKMINIRYNCNATCTDSIVCHNGGYQHPRDCSRCMCTDFHDGKYCEIERGVIDLDELDEPAVLTFKHTENEWPKLDNQNLSNFNKDPVRVIKAPENERIRVTIEKQDYTIFSADQATCVYYGVEIADGDLALTGKKFCFKNTTGYSFVSQSNIIGYRAYSIRGDPVESTFSFSIEP